MSAVGSREGTPALRKSLKIHDKISRHRCTESSIAYSQNRQNVFKLVHGIISTSVLIRTTASCYLEHTDYSRDALLAVSIEQRAQAANQHIVE